MSKQPFATFHTSDQLGHMVADVTHTPSPSTYLSTSRYHPLRRSVEGSAGFQSRLYPCWTFDPRLLQRQINPVQRENLASIGSFGHL
jgi:hypothetical protein